MEEATRATEAERLSVARGKNPRLGAFDVLPVSPPVAGSVQARLLLGEQEIAFDREFLNPRFRRNSSGCECGRSVLCCTPIRGVGIRLCSGLASARCVSLSKSGQKA